ncbi:hypothetical protein NUH86_19030 [Sphingobium sp. JS3065]|uniref:hypothetical protein n=1 Tax=Sphingobium sp. JS3065 TaxID=2970925 RepID=UPI002264036A|nr:hypothetical protein [Sphingobium sp. JS3065]UZW57666.1 hypothetical protein NUH86_19030 [Sphingobium sp. JS3065]
MRLNHCARATLLALALCASSAALGQEKTGNKEGFSLKPGTARIVLMRPVIGAGEQSTGGMYEPNADWTNQARENIAAALAQAQSQLGNQVVAYSEAASGEGPIVTQYSHLFSAVADSVIEYQFFPGNRLPTKKRDKGFEWAIGPGIASLKSLEGADYALFISTHDEYGSTGRKVLQIVGMLGGVGVTSGVHVGHAGLVDLKTGQLVWLNADRQMGGDVRTAEGAQKRVKQLLEGFPGKPAEVALAGQ